MAGTGEYRTSRERMSPGGWKPPLRSVGDPGVQHAGVKPESLVFAGDSGNDLAALIAGYRTIVVANADRRLAQQVQDAHRAAGWKDRLHLARGRATSGVLEGCRRFELVEPANERE